MAIIKCMLTILLLTCFVVLLIIILTDLDNDAEISNPRFYSPNNFAKNFVNLKVVEKNKLLSNSNPTRLLNLKNFQYIIDTKCNYSSEDFEFSKNLKDHNRKIKSIWIITSYAGDVTKRSALRQVYTVAELRELGVHRIFLLGLLTVEAQKETGVTQLAIENEAERFQDIIQGNFIEAYKNLTYKHLMGLQWAVDKCSDSYTYIMKMDDDIVVNLYETLSLLKSQVASNTQQDFLMGYVLNNMTPIRNTASKWYVTYEEFSSETYPSFLSGWFYMTDMLTALKIIYQSKHHTKYFWIDDLFVTGILREEAGINSFKNIKDYFTSDYRFLECCLKGQDNLMKYKCDYIVGPDGGNPNLLSAFKNYSEHCYNQNCTTRPKNKLLKDTCILDYRNSKLGTGSAQVESWN